MIYYLLQWNMENTKFHNTQEFPLHCPELDDLVKGK